MLKDWILVVDDEPSVIGIIVAACQEARSGVEVRTAADGEEALNLVDPKDMPVLIISDLNMPKVNGRQLLRTFKGQVPVIIITGFTPEDVMQSLKAEGAYGVFPKPFDMSSLIDTITDIMKEVGV